MANVWDYLRGNKLCGVLWNSYDAIVQACKNVWDFLGNDQIALLDRDSRVGVCQSLGGPVLRVRLLMTRSPL